MVPQPAQPDRLPSFAAGRRPVPVGRRRRLGPLGRLSGHADRQRVNGLCRRLAARQRALRRTGPALPVRRDRERADRAGGLSGLLRHFLLDRVHLQHTGRLLAGIHRIRGYGVAARRLARSVPDPRPGQRARSGQRLRLRPFSGRAVELYSHSRPADLHGHTVSLFREDRDRLVAAQRGNSLSRIRLHDHGARSCRRARRCCSAAATTGTIGASDRSPCRRSRCSGSACCIACTSTASPRRGPIWSSAEL